MEQTFEEWFADAKQVVRDHIGSRSDEHYVAVGLVGKVEEFRREISRLETENQRIRDDYAGAVGFEWDGGAS